MKGAFELSLILIFTFPAIILGINFVEILMSYNQARYLQDYAISTIEHQNRLDQHVQELIDDQTEKYPSLKLSIHNEEERYLVKVTFPIKIALIGYEETGCIQTLTQIIR